MSDEAEFDTGEYPPFTPSPPCSAVRVGLGARSHPGLVRPNNEDHFVVARISRTLEVLRDNLPGGTLPGRVAEEGYAMAVADGMGGVAAGEQASMIALRTGVEIVLDSAKWTLRIDDREARYLIGQMRDYFQKANQVLIEQGRLDPRLAGMATTLIVAYSVGADAFIMHAGDSRAYLLRDGELHRLTRDHTIAQLLADAGVIEPERVARHSQRHVLTNYIGGPPSGMEPAVATLRLADGDRLLLCSDGLTGMVADGDIAEALRRHPDPDDACRRLVELALEGGGKDNVTVVLARYEVPAAAP